MYPVVKGIFFLPIFALISAGSGIAGYVYLQSRWSETYEGQILEKLIERRGAFLETLGLNPAQVIATIGEFTRAVAGGAISRGQSEAVLQRAAQVIQPKVFPGEGYQGQVKVQWILYSCYEYIYPSDGDIYAYLRNIPTIQEVEEAVFQERFDQSVFGSALTTTKKALIGLAIGAGLFFLFKKGK